MRLPLVVGVDGSEPSLRAVDWAADEAALRGLPLRLVYASLWERYEGAVPGRHTGEAEEQMKAEDIVGTAERRARLRRAGIEVSTGILAEEPEYALLREARQAAALVVGSRGRGPVAELLLGSVGLTAAAHADCPVIVVRGGHDGPAPAGPRGRIVVGVGEHPGDSAAVRFAAEEAHRRHASLEAVRAWRCPAHETSDHPQLAGEPARLHEQRAVQTLDAALRDVPPDVDLHRRTVEGPARTILLDASADADLLVVGARRRPGHVGLQLGRVAHGVLHHAACPVAVVPQRE
ncbi:universal stress protein [Streptomyces caeni]|uniref:Universal stress protein n=1 Tax=Streptomyces caeni TaxID=2307231 RepID=A0ABW4IPM9_9ACTN